MLEYEWGNPSSVMLTGNEDGGGGGGPVVPPSSEQGGHHHHHHRQIFEHYASHSLLPDHFLHGPGPTTNMDLSHHFAPQQAHQQHVHHAFFDPRAYQGASSNPYPPPQPQAPLSLDPRCGPAPGFMLVPKSEDVHVGRPVDFVGSRIGLNLGGRTYFSTSSEDDFVSRLYRRSRPPEQGSTASTNSPRCQAEGCNADLSQAKHYHRRHKVCEFHSKASTVITMGLTQRFCQQCSRFHLLSEFDNGKRSCRKRLADHNRRRRKTSQQPTQDIHKSQPTNLDNVARSPPDSGAQSSSSVTVAVSPPDYFRQRPYQSTSPSTTSSPLFFSSG